MDTLLRDLRYSVRRLIKAPAFTTIVILTLGLGIGANTAIFTVVDTVLLRPLPYRSPEQLVTIQHWYPSINLHAPVSAPGFRDDRDKTHSYDGVAVETGWNVNLTGTGDPERLVGSRVTGDFFRTLGVSPTAGRAIGADEDQEGRDHIVVLSSGLWKRLYGSDPSVVGKSMQLNGESYQVIGVMPESFRDFFNRNTEIWSPLVFRPEQLADNRRTNEYLNLVARLKPGVSIEQAQTELDALIAQLKRQFPDAYPRNFGLAASSLNQQATGAIRPALLVLLGAVGFVLLIACANVANLLLARAAARLKEIAVRTALGATRWALVRQLLTESVLLALAGGVLGLALAMLGVRSLAMINAPTLPKPDDIHINATIMLFTLGISLLTGLLFGLAPALQTSRANIHDTLKDGGRSSTADRGGQAIRRALVVAEVALALTLLTGAGLLIKSFSRLQGVSPGFVPDNLLTFNLSLPQARYPSDTAQIAFYDAVLPRIAGVAKVRSVGATSVLPFSGGWSTTSFNIEGYQPPTNTPGPWGDIRIVSPDFLKTLGAPLLKGRFLSETDGPGAPKVTVVDEEFVRRYWPHDDPIGKRITFSDAPKGPEDYITVVGVVGHTAHEGLDAERRIQYYLPYRQNGQNAMSFAVRTVGDPLALVASIREAVHSVDKDQPLSQIRSMDQMMDTTVGQRRFSMLLLGVFATLALLLASIGIYGVMSYSVTQRSHELGVRMALGAAKGDVLKLVLRQGMTLAAMGVGLGLIAAFGLTRLLTSQLFQVPATDPFTYAGVALILGTIALAANLIPALRATRVDPVVALRDE
ncbi:MAG: ABC transporter permease [Gemmatimonadota bacterium]